MRLLFGICLACLLAPSAMAQSPIHLYAVPEIGTMYYVGELKDNSFPQGDYLHLMGGAGLQMQYEKYVAVTLGYTKGKLSGADSLGTSNPNRDFFFRSSFDEVFLKAKVNLFNHKKDLERRNQLIFWPGLVVGVGYFWFNPQVKLGEFWLDAQPLGTEGQNIPLPNYASPYALNALSFKVGYELSFYVSRRVEFNTYFNYNFTNTDYIDDVGGLYPNPTELLAMPNGPLTAAFTYRYREDTSLPEEGAPRGNPSTNDGFVSIGANFTIKLTGEKRSSQRSRKRFKLFNKARF